MLHCLLFAALFGQVIPIGAQISVSSDLNCDFERPCRWTNGTNGLEDGADWAIGKTLDVDEHHQIAQAMNGPGGLFAYTVLAGGPQALLVSDVIQCQLGGSQLRYWYFRMEEHSTLDVCVRQPPGHPAKLDCYAGIAGNMARQWIYRSVELPPMSQPFELIFRATFTSPSGTVALDEIIYDAILCDPLEVRVRRSFVYSSPIPMIGYNDWQMLKLSNLTEQHPTMLVVAQNTPVDQPFFPGPDPRPNEENMNSLPFAEEMSNVSKVTTTSIFPTTAITSTSTLSSSTSTTTTTTTTTTTSTSIPETTTEPLTSTATVSSFNQTTSSTTAPDHVANLMNFLRQVSPILPLVPGLVRTLQATDPAIARATGRNPLEELAGMAGIDISGVGTSVPAQPIAPPPGLLPFHSTGMTITPMPMIGEFLTGNTDMKQLGRQLGLTGLFPPKESPFLGGPVLNTQLSGYAMANARPPASVNSLNQYGFERTITTTTAMPDFVIEDENPPVTVYPPKVFTLIPGGYGNRDNRDENMRDHQKRLDIEGRIRPLSQIVDKERREKLENLQHQYQPDNEDPENLDLSLLDEEEIRHLEDIHRKIFAENRYSRRKGHTKVQHYKHGKSRSSIAPPLVVFDKAGTGAPLGLPTQTPYPSQWDQSEIRRAIETSRSPSTAATFHDQLSQLSKHLPPSMLADLSKLREIPDLESLTTGMDLSLLNRPGGFATLKQQFIERLIRRNLGSPPDQTGSGGRKPLPPPIVPVKISSSGMVTNFDE